MTPSFYNGFDPNMIYAEILVQPSDESIRYRYESEGGSKGIKGTNNFNNSTLDKTYAQLRVNGYEGNATVFVSCVTENDYKQHPHKLVGQYCENGVAKIHFHTKKPVVFDNLSVQVCKKDDCVTSLDTRRKINFDPFKKGFDHIKRKSDIKTNNIDIHVVRLCFHVRLDNEHLFLEPIVSNPIYNKQSKKDLIIHKISHTTSFVNGGQEILVFCEKVIKDDVAVRFYETDASNRIVWEQFVKPTYVHKQTAIAFFSPKYYKHIEEPVNVHLQLNRPSMNIFSIPQKFQYIPDYNSTRSLASTKRRKIEHNKNLYCHLANPNIANDNYNSQNLYQRINIATSNIVNTHNSKFFTMPGVQNRKTHQQTSNSSDKCLDIPLTITYPSFEEPLSNIELERSLPHTDDLPINIVKKSASSHLQTTSIRIINFPEENIDESFQDSPMSIDEFNQSYTPSATPDISINQSDLNTPTLEGKSDFSFNRSSSDLPILNIKPNEIELFKW